ncbi:hypothetical protein ABID56_000239 [Alkalibacillus flavidus]|uniref:Uncharacterized protein n=1 Tax=Alkalibacillus flavidus TaxID=546021 RepID=A0ABV2KRG4_9BACI
MAGSIWYNILLSTIMAVYTFLLSIMNNTPQHSLIRGVAVLIVTFVVVFLIRRMVSWIIETRRRREEDLIVSSTDDATPLSVNETEDQEAIDSEEAAERVRAMMQDEQEQRES